MEVLKKRETSDFVVFLLLSPAARGLLIVNVLFGVGKLSLPPSLYMCIYTAASDQSIQFQKNN